MQDKEFHSIFCDPFRERTKTKINPRYRIVPQAKSTCHIFGPGIASSTDLSPFRPVGYLHFRHLSLPSFVQPSG
jgi:hypothetical protein